MKRSIRLGARRLAFALVVATTFASLVATAQPKKPRSRPAAKAPARAEAGAAEAPLAVREEKTTREEKAPSAGARDAGGGAVVSETVKDGGARVFRFGEVEVEGRLKSPQIVYFLRRVRAEFAAGDLGHRSFRSELGETRNEPGF
jgi:hypothetical protein